MKREFGLDLIRAMATFFIVAVHFFLNSTYYDTKMTGKTMLIITVFRWLFFICVPLFIILTGYLKSNKKINKEHYKGIKHILISYIFVSIVVLLFRKYYLKNNLTWVNGIIGIFNFTTNNYSWYIEMYIGLFLLIPFLNIMYKACETKKNKQILIATMVAITSFSPLVNMLSFNKVSINIIPDWWNNLYPLGYYFIGCYIKEYRPKINKIKSLLIILLIASFEAIASYVFRYKSTFSWGFIGGYNNFFTVGLSTIVFLAMYDIKCSKKFITKPVELISNLSLNIYLFSKISDSLIYPNLKKAYPLLLQYIKYMPIIIIASFSIAFALALLKKLLFVLLSWIIKVFKKKTA